jgi:hypothetical protein
MPRFLRNTVLLVKTETTIGTDAVPTGAANAILVSDITINPLQASNVNRDLVRGFYGSSDQLVGTASIGVSFTVELAGSGTPTTAPKWGPLLLACGFAETVQTASVDYLPVSTFGNGTSATIYYYLDGQLHKLLAARGTFTLEMGVGERPVMRFRMVGKDGGLTAAANATPVTTGFRTPLVITDANTPGLRLGAVTYTAATGIVGGGTVYTSRGLRLDVGNNVTFQPLLGAETVEITQREVTGAMSLDLTAAQAVSFMTDVKANTTLALGFTHGVAAGNTIVIHAPVVQRIDPGVEDFNGQAMHTYNLRLVPSAGNDELRIVSR